jgi:hypothetical protein
MMAMKESEWVQQAASDKWQLAGNAGEDGNGHRVASKSVFLDRLLRILLLPGLGH